MCKIFSCLENVIFWWNPWWERNFCEKCIDLEKLLIYCELAEFEGKKSWPISPHEMQSVEFSSEILHIHAKSSKWVNIYGRPSNNGLKIMVSNLLFTIVHLMMYILQAGINCLWYWARVFSSLSNSKNYKVSKMSIYTTSSSISIEFYQAWKYSSSLVDFRIVKVFGFRVGQSRTTSTYL